MPHLLAQKTITITLSALNDGYSINGREERENVHKQLHIKLPKFFGKTSYYN